MRRYFKTIAVIFLIISGYILLQLLVAAGFAAAGGIGVQGDIQGAMEDYVAGSASLISLVSNALAAAALLLCFGLRGKSIRDGLRLYPMSGGKMALSAGLGLFAAAAVTAALSLLPIPEEMMESYVRSSAPVSSGPPFIRFAATVIAAPATEEIIFRGTIYGMLKKCSAPAAAVLVSCAFFALLHGDPLWIAYAFAMGVALTLAYEKFGSLLAPMLMHMAFNLCGGYFITGA